MNLTAVFTAPPQFTIVTGRTKIGRADPNVPTEQAQGLRPLLLAGRQLARDPR